jgi:hypothetical protein
MRRCRALYNFEAHYVDELTFRKGWTILILNKVNESWMTGVLEKDSTKRGLVLVEYVVMLPDLNQENSPLGSESGDLREQGRVSPIIPNC